MVTEQKAGECDALSATHEHMQLIFISGAFYGMKSTVIILALNTL